MDKLCFKGLFLVSILFSCQGPAPESTPWPAITAINESALPRGAGYVAIVGATIIDGTDGDPITNGTVLVRGNRIEAVGPEEGVDIPEGAERVEARGWSVLPGFIDAHFHLDNASKWPHYFLNNGITSLRDPGAWIEAYVKERAAGYALPRLFLTGPHLDMFPPAYPDNSYILQDRTEARTCVQQLAAQGASAIKVYFRLSLGLIEEVCATAHEVGLPVTAHLEITDARDAIAAGLDGIEHVTSFGPALLPGPEAEAYRQAVLADNNARRKGRYEVWNRIDLDHPRVDELIRFLAEKQTFVCPTLGAFEYRIGPDKTDSLKLRAFQNMQRFIGKAHRAGVRIVTGSHSWVPYAEDTWSYHHEMELLAACGLSNAEVIRASTLQNARFFRIADRLGSIEAGKLADLVLIAGNPLADLSAVYRVERVMLNGFWVTP